MPSNFSNNEVVATTLNTDTLSLHEAEAYARFYWAAFVEQSSNTSLASLYGAFLALAEIYRRRGYFRAVRIILEKLESALFHVLENSDAFELEYIYPHIDVLLCLDEYARARKVAQRCIKIIMSKNKDLTQVARRKLRDELEESFFGPIEERFIVEHESVQIAESLEIPKHLFDVTPRQDGLGVANWGYGIVWNAWVNHGEQSDQSDDAVSA